eukprot:3302504-Rhodomonas_salina.4
MKDEAPDATASPPAKEPTKTAAAPAVVSSSADPVAAMKGQADTIGKFMTKLSEYKECKDKEQRCCSGAQMLSREDAARQPDYSFRLSRSA